MTRGNLQSILMPVAMIAGGLLHNYVVRLDFLTPYLIFTMLFIPFCGVGLREIKISGLHINRPLRPCWLTPWADCSTPMWRRVR